MKGTVTQAKMCVCVMCVCVCVRDNKRVGETLIDGEKMRCIK
jgi:hypothetical protein